MKLWGGRFKGTENELMEIFNKSLDFDKLLWEEDIEGSIAHVEMLGKCNILKEEEVGKIISGLLIIKDEILTGKLKIEGDYEDIHSFMESKLIEKIGDVGKKLHTARSRNDQVAVDMRLYSKKKAEEIVKCISDLLITTKTLADENHVIMPGYTHLQRAQVVTFKHHMMAYYNMFLRDKRRVENAVVIMNESPLGCCALAGTTYDTDRDYTASKLGFKKPVDNFMDGVSDRDYLLELLSNFSIIMMHLSRLSEEIILWSSSEFSFIKIDDAYSTGSSIMPQKKNPDAAELIRGKTGRVYGALMSLLTTLKGLPLAYNKDMQEDKEVFFDSADTIIICLKIMTGMLGTLKINVDKMFEAVKKGFLNATELADYLVGKGIAFRDAHKIVGEIVVYCEDNNKAIEDLTLSEFNDFCKVIDESVYEFIDYKQTLNRGIKKNL